MSGSPGACVHGLGNSECWQWNWQRRELCGLRYSYYNTAPTDGHLSLQLSHPLVNVHLPTMNYGKKDEDADTGLVKVDRTQVFQEGEFAHITAA